MMVISAGHSQNKNKLIRKTVVRLFGLHAMRIMIVTICFCFSSNRLCEGEIDNYGGMNEKCIPSNPSIICKTKNNLDKRPQKAFDNSSGCIEYEGMDKTFQIKKENGPSVDTIIKIFTFLLAFLTASFTAFSIIIGLTSWKTKSLYEKEVERAEKAANNAEKILEEAKERTETTKKELNEILSGIKEEGDAAVETFAKFISTTTMLEHYLSRGKDLAKQISTTSNVNQINMILPEERDLLKFSFTHLQSLSETLTVNEKARYKETFEKLLKEAQDTKADLTRVRFPGMVQDLNDTCNEIIKILEMLIAKPGNST